MTLSSIMLAYVFWHIPRADVDEAIYASRLARFQEELEQLGPNSGLVSDPACYRLADVPWINAGRDVYMDLYLLETSAQMDVLNNSAVTGPMVEPHAGIASLYGKGAAQLYSVRLGTVNPAQAQHAYFFGKPSGMSYEEFDQTMAPVGGAVLRRMMVLGPAPEFCLLTPQPVTMPIGPYEERRLTAM